MAHFTKLDTNNVVEKVIVVNNAVLLDENGVEQEQLGIDFCKSIEPGAWVQTSYNGSFRKNFAGTGWTWDPVRDAFIAPQPFPSWTLDEETCDWVPPVPRPADQRDTAIFWNEAAQAWDEINVAVM